MSRSTSDLRLQHISATSDTEDNYTDIVQIPSSNSAGQKYGIQPRPSFPPQKVQETTEGVYKLADFVVHYKQHLPLRIKVVEGFCGKEERSRISTGDVYYFHYVKSETVVFIQDERGALLSIPPNSPIKFGLLYNPVGDMKQAVREYCFKTIGELASCDVIPRVIRATRTFRSGEPQSSVLAEEVLVLKEIITGQKIVKAVNLSGEEKTLHEDCEGHFMTGPPSVQLQVTDIINLIGDYLPLMAVLFLDSHSDVTSPECHDKVSHLASEVITLMSISIESSMIATTCWNREEKSYTIPDIDNEVHIPIAIPIDLKIYITVFGDKLEEDGSLYENTRDIIQWRRKQGGSRGWRPPIV